MPVRTGVLSSATAGKALYDLIAIDLLANPNWTLADTLTGATDSYAANWTSKVWKCIVGASQFFVALSYDTVTNPNQLRVTMAEEYEGTAGANRFRRIPGGGTTAAAGDGSTVTPGATDVVTNTDSPLNQANPNFAFTNVDCAGSAFPFLYKVTNKSITIATHISTLNRWCHVGAFEGLVTGPSDPMPIGMFVHGVNNPVPDGITVSVSTHGDGVVCRNPGLGVTAENGAFFAHLAPLHSPVPAIPVGAQVPEAFQGFGSAISRWYARPLMSQAIIHQSRNATNSTAQQLFRGYFSDLMACTIGGAGTEPTGGGVDQVVIDGVSYYWLGLNCPGVGSGGTTQPGVATLIAVRAD